MLIALTRRPGTGLSGCQLTYLHRQPIDVARAGEQHAAYEATLRELGVEVISLPPQPHLPDSVFIEDAAVVLDDCAILTPMGTASRREEIETLAEPLARHRRLERLADGKLEGGDVLAIDRVLYVGMSTRTDSRGISALRAVADRHGATVVPVKVGGCLHLKTACTYLGDDTVLINRSWIDGEPLRRLRAVHVHPAEPFAGNALRIGGTVLMSDGSPRTQAAVEQAGFTTRLLGISELAKAEAGLTCLSLLFPRFSRDDLDER